MFKTDSRSIERMVASVVGVWIRRRERPVSMPNLGVASAFAREYLRGVSEACLALSSLQNIL